MDAKILPFTSEYELHLMDESKKTGHAESIAFPKTAEEAAIPVQKIRHGRLLMLLSRRSGQIWHTTEPTPIKVMY